MTGQDIPNQETAAAVGGAPPAEATGNNTGVSIIEVLTQLAYRKVFIAEATGAGILIGLILSFALPVKYTATTTIMPPQQTPSMSSLLMMNPVTGAGGSSLAALASGGLALKSPNDIYVGLLHSRPVADAIIQRFDLAKLYHAKDMTQARKKLADYTQVTSERNGFITVSVSDKDKERAAEMANTYIDQLRILTKTLAVTEASQRRMFYEGELKQSNEALIAAELAFQQVQQQKGLIQLDAQARAMIEGLASIRAQVAAKQVEVQALRSYSTEHNPDVQLAERELASLEGEEARLEQHNQKPGIAGLELGNVPSAGLDYLRAEHEVQFQQALHDILMKQYEAAKLDEAKEAAVIQVVEPAVKPDRKSSPKRALLTLVFTVAGFLIGCMLAFLMWRKEVAQSYPQTARQFEELRWALTGKDGAKTQT